MTTRAQIDRSLKRIEEMKNSIRNYRENVVAALLARLSDDELLQIEKLLSKEKAGETLTPDEDESLDSLYLRMLRNEAKDSSLEMLKLVPHYVAAGDKPGFDGPPVRVPVRPKKEE